MESVKIEKLLEAYFEGTTSLEQEMELKRYFSQTDVAGHLQQYRPIFIGMKAARLEGTHKEIKLPGQTSKSLKSWWYSVAALLVVGIGAGTFYWSQPRYTQQEKEALAAFEKSREAMMLLSENLNTGAEQLIFVGQFEETKDKIFE